MRFGNLIFGVALLVVASTLALTITFRNAPFEPVQAGKESSAPTAQPGPTPSKSGPLVNSPISSRKSPSRSPRQSVPDAADLDLVLKDGPSAPKLTPAERQAISARTPTVKRAALARLDKMTKRLDLTPAQRQKIFPQLVRSTNGYHEAMVLSYPRGLVVPVEVASDTQSPEEAIHEALDPEQQERFVEEQLDERAWWNEIVAQMEEEFDSSVVAAGTAPPEEVAPEQPSRAESETPAPERKNVFDLIEKE